MSDQPSERSSSSSESGDSRRDPFDVPTEENNINEPSPRSLNEEEHSPSQYQAQKLRDDVAAENEDDDPPDLIHSDSGDDEESHPAKHTKHSPSKNQQPASTDAIYSKFLNMGRQFVAELEDARKKELMQRKSAKKSIDFDDNMPPPHRSRLVFTPPRKSREIIRGISRTCEQREI